MKSQPKPDKNPKKNSLLALCSWPVNLAFTCLVVGFIIISTASTPFPLSAPEKNKYLNKNEKQSTAPPLEFKDLTVAAGLAFTHNQIEKHLTGIDETLAPGACALDYDNDGWVDLLLVNGSGQTRYYRRKSWWQKKQGHALYKNMGNGTFKDVTVNSGINQSSWGMGCVSSDLNNDGHADLFITNLGQNSLYKNNGDGTFSHVTDISGMTDEAWSTSATIADYDGDGLLDIYVANYIDYQKGAKTYEAQSQFKEETPATFTATLYDAQTNRLYRNLGNFKFEDTTFQAGVEDSDGRSLDAIWLNANGDRWPDLYVSNDGGGGSNTLLINQGNGEFSERSSQNNLGNAMGHHGATTGDLDNDGDLDLIVTGNHNRSHLLLINEQGNASSGAWQFSDKSDELGLTKNQFVGYSGWSVGIHDFNNDGWLDIFIANGFTTPDPDSNKVTLGQSKQLWINKGDGSFYDVSQSAGKALQDMESARGSVYADFDNDGDIDIYVAHNNNLGQLLINTLPPEQHWLGIHLVGKQDNRDAIGARVWVKSDDATQLRVASRGNSFLSSNDPRLHFGLGVSTAAVSVTVKWPNGETETFDGIVPNQYLTIEQERDTPVLAPKYIVQKQKPTEKLLLTIAPHSVQAKIKYVQLLGYSSNINQTLPEIEIALQSSIMGVRLAAIEALQKKSANGFHLLIQSLDDEEPNIRQAAVLALRNYEQEESVRWLLRMFDDADDRVRIATIDSFAHFFREEEAVVHRKNLAIPHLIKLLSDSNSEIIVAAIRALGDAEQYRAIAPLVALLNSPDFLVKREAVRALGLLREQKTIKPLLKLLDTDVNEPAIVSQLLIALKRLSYAQIPSIFEQLLDIKKPDGVLAGLKSIEAILLDNEDGIVFNHTELVNLIDRWYFQIETQRYLAQNKNEKQINQAIIDILLHAGVSAPIRLGEQLIQTNDPEIRANAYAALLKYGTSKNITLVSHAINDHAPSVQNALLHLAAKGRIDLPLHFILELLKKEKTSLAATSALIYHPTSEVTNKLYALAHKESVNNTLRIKALEVLGNIGGLLPTLDEILLAHKNSAIREAALRYWNIRNKKHIQQELPPKPIALALKDANSEVVATALEVVISRNETWAQRAMLSALSDQQLSTDLKVDIIKKLSLANTTYAPVLLLKIAAGSNTRLSRVAIKSLLSMQSPLVEKFMWQLLTNKEEHDERRLLAAESLAPQYGEDVIEILQGKHTPGIDKNHADTK